MRAHFGAVGCSLAFLVLGPTVRAQCPVFDQTIVVADQNTVSWDMAADVDFVKGPLSHVSTYATLGRGSATQATSLDISGDIAAPGDGIYYLVTYAEPACASWQTSPGAEPARDTEIYESCNVVSPTDAQTQAAVEAAMVGLVDPWGDTDEFVILWDRIQGNLQCATDLPPAPILSSSAAPQASMDASSAAACGASGCGSTFCPDVGYCGPDNTSNGFTGAVNPGACLNRACFEHDKCYGDTCISEDPECYFSPQSIGTGCEAPFDAACGSCGGFWERTICFVVTVLYYRNIPQICETPTCQGLDTDADCRRDSCAPCDPAANTNGCVADTLNEPDYVVDNCNDFKTCSTADYCFAGTCVAYITDDLRCPDNPVFDYDADCRRDSCAPGNPTADLVTGCVTDLVNEPSNIGGNCQDGKTCTAADFCTNGSCTSGTADSSLCPENASTDSDADCKRDYCLPTYATADPNTGCVTDFSNEPSNIGGNCQDGKTCTAADYCDSSGFCLGGGHDNSVCPENASTDSDADCKRDICLPNYATADPNTGCVTEFSNEPSDIGGNCQDGKTCSTADYCDSPGGCLPGGHDNSVCPENASTNGDADCTMDYCNPLDTIHSDPVTGCVDDDLVGSGLIPEPCGSPCVTGNGNSSTCPGHLSSCGPQGPCP